MRIGDVSFVTPFRYTRILFGVAAGVLLFGEAVTIWLIIGSLIIIGSAFFCCAHQLRRKIYLDNPHSLNLKV